MADLLMVVKGGKALETGVFPVLRHAAGEIGCAI